MTEHKTKVSTFFQAYPAREKGYELSEGFRDYLHQQHVEDLTGFLVRTRDGQLALMNNPQTLILGLFLAVYDMFERHGLRLFIDANCGAFAVPEDALKDSLTFTADGLTQYRVDNLLSRLEAAMEATWAIGIGVNILPETLRQLWQHEVAPHYRLDSIPKPQR